MKTKIISINGTPVPVTGPSAAKTRHALASLVFRNWLAAAEVFAREYPIARIEITAVDYHGRASAGSVLFVRLRVAAANTKSRQIVELRGNTVVMIPVLRCEERAYTILVRQPRLPVGDPLLTEVPAGMVDGDSFVGAAAREIYEELGLRFLESELISLNRRPIYFSPGLLDEGARFFAAERDVSAAELAALQGKATGLVGERIQLLVVPLDEVYRHTRDGKAYIALSLYQRYLERRA